MGWNSAGGIFDTVAQALIDLNANPDTKRRVLGPLITKLQNGDWDTEDESLYAFRSDVTIRALFYERGVGGALGDYPTGILSHDDTTHSWVLTCAGRAGCDELGRGDGDSAAEHDRLVRLWAAHEAEKHDGDGNVEDGALISADGEAA